MEDKDDKRITCNPEIKKPAREKKNECAQRYNPDNFTERSKNRP